MGQMKKPAANVCKAAALAVQFPDDHAGLLAAAEAVALEFDSAVMACDMGAAQDTADRFDAIIWKLNGGTHSGSFAGEDSAGNVIAAHCAAPVGQVPRWGQRGQFVITVDGMRALVHSAPGMHRWHFHFGFHVVDVERPFVSETGYRSQFFSPVGGRTVEDEARHWLAGLMKEKGRRIVKPDHRQSCIARVAESPWLQSQTLDAPPPFEDASGQGCFAF